MGENEGNITTECGRWYTTKDLIEDNEEWVPIATSSTPISFNDLVYTRDNNVRIVSDPCTVTSVSTFDSTTMYFDKDGKISDLIHAIERCGISIEQAINVFNQLYEMITDRKAYMEFAYEDHERGLEITDGALMMLLDGLTEGTE